MWIVACRAGYAIWVRLHRRSRNSFDPEIDESFASMTIDAAASCPDGASINAGAIFVPRGVVLIEVMTLSALLRLQVHAPTCRGRFEPDSPGDWFRGHGSSHTGSKP